MAMFAKVEEIFIYSKAFLELLIYMNHFGRSNRHRDKHTKVWLKRNQQ